jgi:hypothetical protein
MGEHPSLAPSLRSRERNTSAKTVPRAAQRTFQYLAVTRLKNYPYEAPFEQAWSGRSDEGRTECQSKQESFIAAPTGIDGFSRMTALPVAYLSNT